MKGLKSSRVCPAAEPLTVPLSVDPQLKEVADSSTNSRTSSLLEITENQRNSAIHGHQYLDDSSGCDSSAEPTTFQKQVSTYKYSKTSISSIANQIKRGSGYGNNLSAFKDDSEQRAFIRRYKSINSKSLQIPEKNPMYDTGGINDGTTGLTRSATEQLIARANSLFGKFGGKTEAQIKGERIDEQFKSIKRNSRIIIQITRDNAAVLPKLILHPETQSRAYWDVFMMLLVCYYALVTPINICFDESPFDVLELEVLFNCFFVVDIFLQFFTSYKHTRGPSAGRLETRHDEIIKRYLKGWFLIDLVASFPLDIIMNAASDDDSAGGSSINRLLRLVRSVKLMRILRMSRLWKRLLHRVKINPSVVRLFKLFGVLLIEWHWIGCMYWGIAVSEGLNEDIYSDSWCPDAHLLDSSFGSQYLRAYFWAVMVTTGVGFDIIPETDVQYLFTTMAIIVGVLMYAVIVGSVGTALQSIDTPDSQRRRRMDAVREYLRQRDVSPELSDKILNYYDYCMSRHITEHDENVLTEIHSALKEKLDLEVNQQLLNKVPRFKNLPDGLLLVLIHSLVSRIYLPNELVYLIGERASEMFFVVRGDLERLDEFGTTQEFLTDGAFFGDQLFKPGGARRTSTIRCITHCELLILTKTSLRDIMQFFPEFAMLVQRWSGQNKFQSLRGWKRIAYAIRTQRYMKCMGAQVQFMDVVHYLLGDQEPGTGLFEMKKEDIADEHTPAREISYQQFHEKYGSFIKHFSPKKEKPAVRRGSSIKVDQLLGDDDSNVVKQIIIEEPQSLTTDDENNDGDDEFEEENQSEKQRESNTSIVSQSKP